MSDNNNLLRKTGFLKTQTVEHIKYNKCNEKGSAGYDEKLWKGPHSARDIGTLGRGPRRNYNA